MLQVVASTVGGDIEGCNEVVGYLAIGIKQRQDVELDIAVDTHFRIVHMLAYQQVIAIVGGIDIAEQWDVKHADAFPEALGLRVIHATQLFHRVVQVHEPSFLAVERHGDKWDVRQSLVFPDKLSSGLIFLHVLCHVVNGVHNVFRMTVGRKFGYGVALEVQPVGCVIGSLVPSFVQFEMSLAPLNQSFHLLGKLILLVGVHSPGIFCQRHARLRQNIAVAVGHAIVLDVVLHHIEVAHVQRLVHHVV